MDESSARRVVLAWAVETVDTQGKLLSPLERDQADRDARQDAIRASEGKSPSEPAEFLLLRARRVLAMVGIRNPGVAGLQDPVSWPKWVAGATPLAALVVGVLTDAIGNPHRVDLVSLPLLGIVLWNVAMYVGLAGGWLLSRGRERRPLLAGLGRWTDGERALRRRPGNIRAQVTAQFHKRWFAATETLHVERCKRVLHLSAAFWGIGVVLSLLVRGLVVEYRVGWESTFLGEQQVHAILSVLRLPALLVFPFQPFTVQEVAGLQFSQGGAAAAGARWVYLYVALLLVVVFAPRLMLAAWSRWRERMLSGRLMLNLDDPYYRRIVSLLDSTRVQLALLTHRPEDKHALLRVIAQETDPGPVLASSEFGDVLRLVNIPADPVLPEQRPPATEGWLRRALARLGLGHPTPEPGDPALRAVRDESDAVLHVVSTLADLDAAKPLLEWIAKPVLVLVNRPYGAETAQPGLVAQAETQRARLAVTSDVLSFDNFARCWVQEGELLEAIAHRLPEAKAAGFARIVTAWSARNDIRLQRAMAVVAEHLLYAARQVEEVHSSALTVRNLIPAEREAQAGARQGAMDAIVKRLNASAAEMFSRLRKLHGIDEEAGSDLQHWLEEKFVVQQAIDIPQAGIAGAASGAAMGATVDVLAGGLTLGAATALGALLGGGAAYVAAAWKNRSSPSGGTIVQLSDAMMRAMVEAALLRYLAVVHCGRTAPGQEGELRSIHRVDVAAAVQARAEMLPPFWSSSRTQPNPSRLAQPLVYELETMVRTALQVLYRPQHLAPGPDPKSAISGHQGKA